MKRKQDIIRTRTGDKINAMISRVLMSCSATPLLYCSQAYEAAGAGGNTNTHTSARKNLNGTRQKGDDLSPLLGAKRQKQRDKGTTAKNANDNPRTTKTKTNIPIGEKRQETRQQKKLSKVPRTMPVPNNDRKVCCIVIERLIPYSDKYSNFTHHVSQTSPARSKNT